MDNNVRKGLNGLLLPLLFDVAMIIFFVVFIIFFQEPCAGTSIDSLSLLHVWHVFIVVIVMIMIILERLYQPVVVASLGVAAGAFDAWAAVTRFMSLGLGDSCNDSQLTFDVLFVVTAFLYVIFAILSMSYYGCYGLTYVTNVSTSKGAFSTPASSSLSSYIDIASSSALIANKDKSAAAAMAPTTPLPRASATVSAHRRMLHKVHDRLVNE